MIRRAFVLTFCSALAGCTEPQPTREALLIEVESLREQLADSREQLEEASYGVARAQAAVSEMSDAVSSLDNTDWRDVVPRVRDASEELEAAVTDAEQSLDY